VLLTGSVVRLAMKTNLSGDSQYPEAGDVRTYQVWYRNAAAFCTPATFNLSNGLRTTWRP